MEGHVGPGKDFFLLFSKFYFKCDKKPAIGGQRVGESNYLIYILKDYPGCCIENYMGQKIYMVISRRLFQ